MKKTTQVMIALLLLLAAYVVMADPEGATITYLSNTSKAVTSATSRQDEKGTITTITISTIQQNSKWKAYIGNVSGTLVLRDADDYSIYEWTNIAAPAGEVYMTRNTSVDWGTVQCANTTNLQAEQTNLGHSGAASDNIVNTFSSTIHASIDVAGNTISNGTCSSAFTWVNNTQPTPSQNAEFQEVLLMDYSHKIIYSTIINQDTSSYRNDSASAGTLGANHTYDFQAILPDYTSVSTATYYFYVEIDG